MAGIEQSDAELVKQFQGGDLRAFELFMMRFQDRVYRLSLIWLKDEHQAADVTQEVFIRAYKGLGKFRFRATPFTWLYRTTFNICRECNRKKVAEQLTEEPISGGPSIERQVSIEQSARQIRVLVSRLPQRQQEVVVLRLFEQFSVADTARLMKCREGTVKALLNKAMGKLKLNQELLSDYR